MTKANDLDIIPINDIKEHQPGIDCHCDPKTIIEGGVIIFVHNAYDDRETIESVEELLSDTLP